MTPQSMIFQKFSNPSQLSPPYYYGRESTQFFKKFIFARLTEPHKILVNDIRGSSRLKWKNLSNFPLLSKLDNLSVKSSKLSKLPLIFAEGIRTNDKKYNYGTGEIFSYVY